MAPKISEVLKPGEWKVRKDAKYVSARGQEYSIEPVGGMFQVVPYRHSRKRMHNSIAGNFLSYKTCEAALIRRLEQTNRWGRAIYPGCPEPMLGRRDAQSND